MAPGNEPVASRKYTCTADEKNKTINVRRRCVSQHCHCTNMWEKGCTAKNNKCEDT